MKKKSQKRLLYHGSAFRIEKPFFGGGKVHNDYGSGFYCTEDVLLAKEWAIGEKHDGYANSYDFDEEGLTVVDLSSKGFTVLHWLTVLLENRVFDLTGDLLSAAKAYLADNFSVDYSKADVMIGYRADDNYFSFARSFLNGALSYDRLCRAIRLGDLGLQYVIKSERAFERLVFKSAEPVSRAEYLSRRLRREEAARADYQRVVVEPFDPKALYMTNILQQGIKPDDPRL